MSVYADKDPLGPPNIHYIAKSIGHPLLMNRFDYFSNFHEYKS